MEYHTFIFEQSWKKIIRQWLIVLVIILVLIALIWLKVINAPGGAALGIISTGYTLFRVRAHELKDNGVNSYGSKRDIISITEEYIEIQNKRIYYSQVADLVIYVDEYYGMSRPLFGIYHGGNNEISFKYKGQPYSFNYLIKNKKDYHHVEQLVAKIEESYPPNIK